MGEMSEYYCDQRAPKPARLSALLFLDVATSGFDPKEDVVLEVACMLVSATPGLEIIETFHAVVLQDTYSEDGQPDVTVPPFHLTNGLAAACVSGEDIRKVEARLLAGPWSRASRFVNCGVQFDRKFLAAHMPTFAAALPRASLEVNEIEYAAVALGGVPQFTRPERTYRAEDDLAEAYEALRHYTRRKN